MELRASLTSFQAGLERLDARIENDAKLIRDLKRALDDHEWEHRDEVSELIATPGVKLRHHGVADQAFAISELARVLGWSGSTLDVLTWVIKAKGAKAHRDGDRPRLPSQFTSGCD
jgi:hypothetical protein